MLINTLNVLIFFKNSQQYTNIFSLLKIIEHASEIHCMDSCFKHIIDSMDIKHNNLFYHMYVRGINNSGYTQSKLNWKKIF